MQLTRTHFFIAVIILLVGIGSFFYGTHYGFEKKVKSETISALFGETEYDIPDVDFTLLLSAWNIIDDRYTFPDGPNATERLWGAISGLVGSIGDPYSVFLPPREAGIFAEDIQGNFGGVGIEIGMRNGILTVIAPLPGTPGEKAGLLPGDHIVGIDGESLNNITIDEAVFRIRGRRGTTVTLTIFRTGDGIFGGDTFDVEIIRETIRIPTLDTRKEEGVFIITLQNFSAQAANLFEDALHDFVDSGDQKLIIDLRNNPGGFLEVATDIASFFVPGGETIVIEDKGEGNEELVYPSKGFALFNELPEIVILVNEGSASASEIFAAALQDHGIATVVGETTFGKGSVQELIPLTDDTFIKLTVARWLTPNRKSITDNGITPDIEVGGQIEGEGGDPQLERALELLR